MCSTWRGATARPRVIDWRRRAGGLAPATATGAASTARAPVGFQPRQRGSPRVFTFLEPRVSRDPRPRKSKHPQDPRSGSAAARPWGDVESVASRTPEPRASCSTCRSSSTCSTWRRAAAPLRAPGRWPRAGHFHVLDAGDVPQLVLQGDVEPLALGAVHVHVLDAGDVPQLHGRRRASDFARRPRPRTATCSARPPGRRRADGLAPARSCANA